MWQRGWRSRDGKKKWNKEEVVKSGRGRGNEERQGGRALYSQCPILAVGYFWSWLALRPTRVCVPVCVRVWHFIKRSHSNNDRTIHTDIEHNKPTEQRSYGPASSRLSTRQQLVDFTSAPLPLPAATPPPWSQPRTSPANPFRGPAVCMFCQMFKCQCCC